MDTEILSNLIIKNVKSATTMYTEKNVKMKKMCREGWALVLKLEGETVYTQNKKRYISSRTSVVILPKGCSYEWVCTESGHFTIVELDCDVTHHEIFALPVKNVEKILKYFENLEYVTTLKPQEYRLEAIRDAYSIILSLVKSRHGYLPLDKTEKIAPALEYIAKNYTKSITNETLASLTGMSCVYFRKLFTEIMGESPIAYAHALRIKKARQMLKSDHGTISDIAYSLGYSNIFDFSRDFKKHTGIPPSKY